MAELLGLNEETAFLAYVARHQHNRFPACPSARATTATGGDFPEFRDLATGLAQDRPAVEA